MAMDDLSPERKNAMFKWHQAQQEMKKGHAQKAVDLARLALEQDASFMDVRMWLAEHFAGIDEPRKAVHELEEVVHADKENQQAWDMLKRLDPGTFDRLQRLQSIAPDPFVAKRTKPLSEDVVDIGEFYDDDEDVIEAAEDGGDPFVTDAVTDDVLDSWGDDEDETEGVQEMSQEGAGGHVWGYEQDAEFLAKWNAEPIVSRIVATTQELWDEPEAWEGVLDLCAHATPTLHEKIFQAAKTAAARLGVEMPELFVFPERCMHPVLIKDRPPVLAVPSGVLRAMTVEEVLFQVGREVGHLNTGYIAQMQAVKIVTDRKAQLAGDLASTLRDFLGAQVKFWDQGLSRDEVERLKKLGHAWQQRAELTADRAGLVCCCDINVACTAIAKTTARSVDDASSMTMNSFLKQFEGKDVGRLAAIPVEESPSRNADYAAYRIHMLRWWAKTPECMAVLSE